MLLSASLAVGHDIFSSLPCPTPDNCPSRQQRPTVATATGNSPVQSADCGHQLSTDCHSSSTTVTTGGRRPTTLNIPMPTDASVPLSSSSRPSSHRPPTEPALRQRIDYAGRPPSLHPPLRVAGDRGQGATHVALSATLTPSDISSPDNVAYSDLDDE